jgi:DNA polymerase I
MYRVVRDATRLGEVANEINQASAIGLDTETTHLSPHHGKLRLVQINTGQNIYLIDLFHTKTLGPVASVLNEGKAVKVGQNLKFDQKFLLHEYGIEMWPIFDTFRASALLNNGKQVSNGLYDIYERELGIEGHAPDMSDSSWTGELSEEQLAYAAEDVEHLLMLRQVMKPKLAQDGLNRTALIEFQAILAEASMELNGFFLNRETWGQLYEENRVRRDELKERLFRDMPHPKGQIGLPGMTAGWNLNSHVQKLQALRRLGVPVDNTAEMTLAMHAAKFPVLKTLIEYNKVSKLCTAFGPDYLRHIDSVTGRIHTSFYGFLATARYSSSDPNLQQIPRQKRYRKAFAAPPGRIIVVADYSQIELRLVAQISMDRLLMEVYRKGLDAHRQTAALVNAVALDEVTMDMRQSAKPVNFGLCYGMGAERLVLYAMQAYGIALTVAEAEKFRERYFEGYAGVRAWHRRTLAQGKRSGISRTLSGRIRYLEENAHNEILNTPVQGSGADGLKAALPIVYERLKKYGGRAKLVHMVHDEIVIETDDVPDEPEAIKTDLEDGMKEGMQPFLPDVPVVVEGAYGPSWAEH